MSTTFQTYNGNGSTTAFTFTFPYINTTDVKASIGGVATTAYTVSGSTLTFSSAPPAGTGNVKISRDTNNASIEANFQSGSALRAVDFNDNFTQLLYVTQESTDDADSAKTEATTASTNATAAAASASAAQTSASAAQTSASAAQTSASSAQTSATSASQDATSALATANTANATANTASTNASAAVSTANTASTNATTALTNSRESDGSGGFNTAISIANNASTNATNAVSTSNTASTNASNAVSTANTADSNASTALSTANTALTNANTAVTTANTADTNATAAQSAASTAASNATAAQTSATSAQTSATAAQTSATAAQTSAAASENVAEAFTATGTPATALLVDVPIDVANGVKLPTNSNSYDQEGAIRYNTTLDKIEIRKGSGWSTAAGGANISATPPSLASAGDVWYDHDNGRAYVYYNDGDSNQWVEMNPSWNGYVADNSISSAKIIDGAIVDADVNASAAIAGTKVSPNFGSQNVITTGNVDVGAFDASSATAVGVRAIASTGQFVIQKPASSAGNAFEVWGGTTRNASIDESGSASFASGNFDLASYGALSITRTDGNNFPLLRWGTNSSYLGGGIYPDGSASFSGDISIHHASTTTGSGKGIKFITDGGVVGRTRGQIDINQTAGNGGDLLFSTTADGASSPTERLRIDSSGNVGIGVTSMDSPLEVAGTGPSLVTIHHSDGATGDEARIMLGALSGQQPDNRGAGIAAVNNGAGHDLIVKCSASHSAGPSEKMRIDSSGNVQARRARSNTTGDVALSIQPTDSTVHYGFRIDQTNNNLNLDKVGTGTFLTIDNSGFIHQKFTSNNSSTPEGLLINNQNNVTGNNASLIFSNDSGNRKKVAIAAVDVGNYGASDLVFALDGADSGSVSLSSDEKMRIDSSGRLLVGTTSAGSGQLTVASTSHTGITIRSGGASTNSNLIFADAVSGADVGVIQYKHSDDSLRISVNNGERLRIDSSGRLLVGTSSNTFSNASVVIRGNPAASGVDGTIQLSRDSLPNASTSGIGQIYFTDNSSNHGATIAGLADAAWTSGSSHPTRLVFSTTADGASSPTERMRIANNGVWSGFSDSLFNFRSAQAASASLALIDLVHSATNIGNGTLSLRIWTNGNVVNTNNSYGAISDAKLKENIVDANSQWDDLKAVQVRNYNFIEGQTHTQIGVVAQEIETVSPGLVTESPDRDEEGNDLGTTTKSVNYSVLYMKAVKALQEAMERIETLETKVTALEGA